MRVAVVLCGLEASMNKIHWFQPWFAVGPSAFGYFFVERLGLPSGSRRIIELYYPRGKYLPRQQ